MNAMWGAGQMMFNKILVLVDGEIKIQNYEELAKYVFKNMNPATDIYFSTGPMDVLDHSCSKLGFGGKMCIDGTAKFEEEITYSPGMLRFPKEINVKKILEDNPEITHINASLLPKDIPCIIVSVKKDQRGHVKRLHQNLCRTAGIHGIKLILYVEHTVDANDLPTALWRFCNNLDPKRDHDLYFAEGTGSFANVSCMGFDGTRKTKEFDDFHRDWPNIIVADNATIMAVDTKWNDLGIGNFIPSPSLKFKDQMYGEEAIVSESIQQIKV